jgi:hypothetical protein
MLPTCDDKESSLMMMTHTWNTSSLRWQEVGRRKGVEEVVVIWGYSVTLVWLVWFVSNRFVNEIIKWLDYQSTISKRLIIKGLDNQVQISVWLSNGLIIKTKHSIIKSINTPKKTWSEHLIYTSHIHWVVWGTGTPKDRDEVNRKEFWVCDGWVWSRSYRWPIDI